MNAVHALIVSAALFSSAVVAQDDFLSDSGGSTQEFAGFGGFGIGEATPTQEFYSISGKASVNSFVVNESFYIALNGKVADTYHAYWRNPGTVGEPITATLTAPEGFKVEGPYWEVPHRVTGDFSTSYSYEAPIAVWKVTPTAITEQNVEFTITSTAQTCNDMGCNAPETKTVTIQLHEGDGAPNPDWAAEETKTEVLGDTPLTVSANQTATEVTLNISGVDTIENAYFFSDDNSINPIAEQKLTKTDNGYSLTLPRNNNEDPLHPVKDETTVGKELCELKGILTFDGKHSVVTLVLKEDTQEPVVIEEETEEDEEYVEEDDEEEDIDEYEEEEADEQSDEAVTVAPATGAPVSNDFGGSNGNFFDFGGNSTPQEFYTVNAKANVTAYQAGNSFYIALNGKVADTYHAYWRNPGTVGDPITATLTAPTGFKVEGPYWEVPHRVTGDFSTSYSYEAPIAVWKVTPEENAPQNADFVISSTAQTCNDMGCNQPETKTVTVSLVAGDATPNPDWAAEETKTEVLGDTALSVSATQTTNEVVLNISGVDTIENAYFFSEDNSINPVADQKLTKTDNGYTLTLPRNDNEDPLHPVKDEASVGKELSELKGILTFDGKHSVVQYSFTAATEPAEEATTVTEQPKEEPTVTEHTAEAQELKLWLTVDKESYKKGESFHIALNTQIIEGHHGYWRNPGIAGLPMTATLKAPSGFKVEGPYWTLPHEHDGAYSYENEQASAVWVVTPQENAPAEAEFCATCSAQLCNATGCLPPNDYTAASLQLKEGEAKANSAWSGIESKVEVLGNAEVTVSATQTTDEIILTIKGVDSIGKAYFFADEQYIIDSIAEQKLQKGEDAYTLTLKRQNDDYVPAELKGQTVKQLKGILTFDGKHAGISVAPEVTAVAAPVPPTTTYIYVALLICLGVTLVLTFSNLCGEHKPYVVFMLYVVSSLLIAVYLQDKMAATPMDFFITLTCYAAAFWALQRWFVGKKTVKARIISGISALLLVGAFVYTSFPTERPTIWQEWTPENMAQALKEGKPVYVDFTATWCATCQTNKKTAYSDEVLEKFKHYNVVLMKADKTNPNPEIDKEMKRIGRSQVPTNVLYVPTEETKNTPENVHYEITQEIFTADYLSDFITNTMEGQKTETKDEEEASGFWQIIGLLFLGGLILNFMPCVFPVIGIKVMSFVELGGGSRSKIFMHSMAFVAGIIASFFTLSILLLLCFSAEDRSWAVWMQNPWVVYGIVLLLLILGLSMFGLFEIGVGATGAGQKLQNKEGMLGSFFQGVFITIVATPCSAPFLGSAMPLALALPNVQMVLAFCFMGIGLAFPYIMLGAFPKLIAFLPRPGAWMESLKKGLSFMIFGAAAWILSVYLPMFKGDIAVLLLGMLIISFAFWVYGKWCPIYQNANVRRNGALVALLMLVLGVWITLPLNATEQEAKQAKQEEAVKQESAEAPATEETAGQEATASVQRGPLPENVKLTTGDKPEWNEWTPTIIEDCLKAGYPVYADFTASWCGNCLINKKVAYTPETCGVFKSLQVVMVKVDLSENDKAPGLAEKDKLGDLLTTNNRNNQIPINVLYIPSAQEGEQPKLLLTESKLTPEYLQKFLKDALY